MDLAEALGLGATELVAFVGAGGKKTAMGRLVECAVTRGRRVGYTTTTHTPPPPGLPLVLAAPDELSAALGRERQPERSTGANVGSGAAGSREVAPDSLAFARERVPDPARADEKLRGFEPAVVDDVFASGLFEWVLVKADGARRREIKAPGPHEPPVPTASTVVLPVVSVAAVGEPLTEAVAHRPERVAAVTGLATGDRLTADALARLLASPEGGRKAVPAGARGVPVVNKADTRAERETGRQVIERVLALTDAVDRGLVTSFEQDVVAVLER